MARRTVLKLTRWSEEEWSRVEGAARPHGVPPLRYVREAVLERAGEGGPAPARARRRPKRRWTDELVHQLARVLNNLNQLHRVAEVDGADTVAELVDSAIRVTEAAIRAAPAPAREADAVLVELVPAGVALNELAHRANAAEDPPPVAELRPVLDAVQAALRRCLS